MLSTFLSSSLNIELVYIILAGITKFSSGSQNKRDDKSMIQKQQEKELTKSLLRQTAPDVFMAPAHARSAAGRAPQAAGE